MDRERSKRILSICIIKILEKHSDAEHMLSQNDIIGYLKAEFSLTCGRRSVADSIKSIKNMGLFSIVTTRNNGCYLEHREFEDEELNFLIDGVYCSKIIWPLQKEALIDKLAALGSATFQEEHCGFRNVCAPHNSIEKIQVNQIFWCIKTIKNAIKEEKKVEFTYNKYRLDKQLHPAKDEKYVVNPFLIVCSNARYYLVCSYPKHGDGLSHFRLDLMSNMRMTSEPREIGEFRNIDYWKHANENVYMYGGESGVVSFEAGENIIGAVIDWFGRDFTVQTTPKPGTYSICLKANYNAFVFWALQYGKHVTITYPPSVRDEIIKTIAEMIDRYKL